MSTEMMEHVMLEKFAGLGLESSFPVRRRPPYMSPTNCYSGYLRQLRADQAREAAKAREAKHTVTAIVAKPVKAPERFFRPSKAGRRHKRVRDCEQVSQGAVQCVWMDTGAEEEESYDLPTAGLF